jgi:hypothetical protein
MRVNCVGGIDNRPALLEACRLAAESRFSDVVWVCGPQPLTSDSYKEQLLQTLRRTPFVKIVAVAVADGRNTILAELEDTGVVSALPRTGALAADLRRLFSEQEYGPRSPLEVIRERVPLERVKNAVRASSHLYRLWARDEALLICRSRDTSAARQAADLAARAQIITPVSGAVVLENEQQYKQTGLEPVDPASVPSVVPEPAGWVTMAAGLISFAAVRRRRAIRAAASAGK